MRNKQSLQGREEICEINFVQLAAEMLNTCAAETIGSEYQKSSGTKKIFKCKWRAFLHGTDDNGYLD